MTPPPRGWEGRSAREWAEILGLRELELHAELPSTNDRARLRVREGAPSFAAVVAGHQTAGRGREGRRWHSPRDAGLWISVILGEPSARAPGLAPLAVGVATAEALEAVAGLAVAGIGIKWPNDLFAGGGKVAGVLCETERGPGGPRIVAGIGVNLRRPRESLPPEAEGAVFLEEVAGEALDPPTVAEALVGRLRRWADPLPERVEDGLEEAFSARDLLCGRSVESSTGIRGRAIGLEPDGRLRVEERSGAVHRVAGGSVRVVDGSGEGPGRRAPPPFHAPPARNAPPPQGLEG
jgi:BirA family transcriptional regulator, biotin operon repressor / biotin---[acetyl-CoA-carboxylase] ligase